MSRYGPCEAWPAYFPCDISCQSPSVTGQAVDLATEVIWALSGRQFGLCEVTLRPCRRSCNDFPWVPDFGPWAGQSWINPSLIQGQWFNVICGRCTTDCSCSTISEIYLPAPVDSIVEVKIDGVIVTGSDYRLDNGRILVLLNGDEWPRCNDLSLPDTEIGTWSVTAMYGDTVPEGGKWAVGELACELMRAMNGEDCRLPQNVSQLVRQGVTIEFPDIRELMRIGLTGLYLVDQFISTWNPSGLRRRSGVYSVDRPNFRRVGT
jgi:hypothetical protein